MAMKTNFEEANFISSPYVDEIANPGSTGAALSEKARKTAQAMNAAFARKPTPTAQISAAERKARTTPAQKVAQAKVDLADTRFGDPDNKNKAKAEGR